MYRKEEEKIKSGFDNVAPDLFGEIKKREYKKIESEEELFGALESAGNQNRNHLVTFPSRMAWGSIAAVIICCLICVQLLAPKVQATKILIDANDGMQFMVTKSNHKIEVVALNANSEKIAKEVSGGNTLEGTVYEILENLNQNDYFQESDAGMLVSYVNQKKDDSKKKVSSVIRRYFQKQNLSVSLVQQEVEEKSKLQKEAEKQGISLGKYCFLKTLQEEYQIDAQPMYQKGVGDILQEIDQQGIDLSKAEQIEYLSGEEVAAMADVSDETAVPEQGNVSKAPEDKKEKEKTKPISDKNNSGGLAEEKKSQTKKNKKLSANPKPETGGNQKEKPQKKESSVLPVPTPAVTPVPTMPAEPLPDDGTGMAVATTEPVVEPQMPNTGQDDKVKQEPEKNSETTKHSDKKTQDKWKDHGWNGSGKDHALDCDVDDMKEQIKEYMKNQHHSKKGVDKE